MKGKIIIPANTNVWPHELKMAKILSSRGHEIEFIIKSEGKKVHSADILLDREAWELKSPNGKSLKSIHRNIMRGKRQSDKIVFASWRMKHIPDTAIQRELTTQLSKVSGVSKIKFINRHEEVIDIK